DVLITDQRVLAKSPVDNHGILERSREHMGVPVVLARVGASLQHVRAAVLWYVRKPEPCLGREVLQVLVPLEVGDVAVLPMGIDQTAPLKRELALDVSIEGEYRVATNDECVGDTDQRVAVPREVPPDGRNFLFGRQATTVVDRVHDRSIPDSVVPRSIFV